MLMAIKIKTIGAEYHRAKYDCLQNFVLFEDLDFPAEDTSLFYSGSQKKNVIWQRPSDIHSRPLFFHAKKIITASVDLGNFSNSWMASALDAVVQNPALLSFVVPPGQSFTEDYVGMFRFRIWQYGTWCEVTIDDRLPYDREEEKLLGLASVHGDYWASLLEKAYAKVLGKYEDLSFVQTNDALTDFTSGLAEMHQTNMNSEAVYHAIRCALKAGSIVMAYKVDNLRYPRVEQAWTHVFITGVSHSKQLTFHNHFDSIELYVRLRVTNEYALLYKEDEQFYYSNLANEFIEELHNLTHVEGEVWMKYDAFRAFFSLWSVVHMAVHPESPLAGLVGGVNQNLMLYHGEWIPGSSAGSCNDPRNNDRYPLMLFHPEENLRFQTVVIGLMQIKRKLAKHSKNTKMNKIGFHLYSQKSSFLWKRPIDFDHPLNEGQYHDVREYCRRFRLPLGNYVIVPCTVKPNRHAEYLLRVLTENSAQMTFSQKLYHKCLRLRTSLIFPGFSTFLVFLLLMGCLLLFCVQLYRWKT